MAKRLFYICASILCLALAFHLGASNAQSRPTTNTAATLAFQGGNSFYAMTAVGDVYRSDDAGITWRFTGNIFGASTPTGP